MATSIIEQLGLWNDANLLYWFLDPSEGWTPVDRGRSHAYGAVEDGRAHSTLGLEATGDGTVYAASLGILSARPPGYDSIRGSQSIVNEFTDNDSRFNMSEEDQIEDILDDPLVDQPIPETIDLYVHVLYWPTDQFEVMGFVYRNVEVSSLESTLEATTDKPYLFGLQSAISKETIEGLTKADLVKLLVAGIVDVPIHGGKPIGKAAPIDGTQNRWAEFAVCTEIGPIDPVHLYTERESNVTPSGSFSASLSNLKTVTGDSDWPLMDSSDVAAFEQLAATTILPMAVLEANRETLNLDATKWRSIGDCQKDLYLSRLHTRASLDPVSNPSPDPTFEFEVLEWQNVFQLEAVTEFYMNRRQPWTQNASSRTPSDDLTGSGASVTRNGWKSTVSLSDSPDLSKIIPNMDLLYLEGDEERSERAFLIIDVDDAANEVVVYGKPDVNATLPWTIPLHTTVDFLNPTGATASFTDGSKTVTLTDANVEDLRWLWLLPDDPDKFRTLPDTLRLESMPGEAYRIEDVDLDAKTVTVAESVDVDGSGDAKESAWTISRRSQLVLVDPLGGRLTGSEATVPNSSSPQLVALDGPTPDLGRINSNFDTLWLADDQGIQTYRILAKPGEDHDAVTGNVPNGHVVVHEKPSLSGGSRWKILSGVGATLPPLYYDLGAGGPAGYDNYDGAMFVVRDGRIHHWSRWNSYTGRYWAATTAERSSLSSVRGNARYEFLSYRSGTGHLNYCFRVYDVLSRHQIPDGGWTRAADTVRDTGFFFNIGDGTVWDPVNADRTPPSENSASNTDATDDGKSLIRLHWSPHYRPGNMARSGGCITSPSYPATRDELIRLHVAEHELVFDADGTKEESRDQFQNLLGKDARDSNDNANIATADWTNHIGGTFWLIRPDQRPIVEEGDN